jgi:hypothetical protein
MRKDLEVISIFGARGSGKSTRAKEMLNDPRRKRVIVYDIKAEYPFKKIRGAQEFAKFMRVNWRKDFKISYVPEAKEKPQHIIELSELCYALVHQQEDDYRDKIARDLTLLVEEMSISAPNQKYPVGQGGFEYAVNVGREWGIEIIGVSQRPAQVNPDYRGNASEVYYFALSDGLDEAVAKQKIGEHAAKLKSMQPHNYIKFYRGNIKYGKNTTNFQ